MAVCSDGAASRVKVVSGTADFEKDFGLPEASDGDAPVVKEREANEPSACPAP